MLCLLCFLKQKYNTSIAMSITRNGSIPLQHPRGYNERYMAYTTNPNMPKVRRDAVRLVKYRGWSIRKVAKHLGYAPSTVSRWCKRDSTGGWHEIPTRSSKPKTSPRALPREIVLSYRNVYRIVAVVRWYIKNCYVKVLM